MPFVLDIETVGRESCKALVKPAKNLKDPAKIAADLEERWQKMALNPNFADIVCLGILDLGDVDRPHLMIGATDDERVWMLDRLWDFCAADHVMLTFNGLRYDLPVCIRQSQLLGIDYPKLDLSPYRAEGIDLYQYLTHNGTIDGLGLQAFCRLFGREAETGEDGTGSQVAEWYAARDWQAIKAHCEEDLRRTAWLARRLKLVR